ncbi:hypothetical protein HYFRA_00001748 [Hymenoscyphus fraxineus]|uniref:Uncharacterized protein n=1 Tax=Hymenoscyphus fraxineus TaxID=746836 RepID=A0A9N9PMN5_9HELO|nr:hypothetical protein HYFRA_00001748 [Hymenoscyphus fraxineus]
METTRMIGRQDEEADGIEPESSANLFTGIELQEEEVTGKKRDLSGKLPIIGVLFTAFLLLFLGFSSTQRLSDSSVTYSTAKYGSWGIFEIEHEDLKPILGIKLHPEDHENRPARTITYRWTISSDHRSPDGVKKKVYLVNGQFPGPTIECRSGDRLIVHVTNKLNAESLSVHWHGLHMRNANSMDGATGITQCPIPEGTTFTYDFKVDGNQSGTFWWHAHSQVQRGDGMYGGLVVHKPFEKKVDVDELDYDQDMLLMVGDWYHRPAEEVLSWYMSSRGFGNEPVPDSLLINGAGRFQCSMAVPARPVDCRQTKANEMPSILREHSSTRLRVVNTG